MTILLGGYGIDQMSIVDWQGQAYLEKDMILLSSTKNNSHFYHDALSGLVIIADARIFNRNDLFPKSSSDAELILRCYQRWGKDCVDKLVGDFAFAIWDSANNHLFIASDPFGQRAWYYHKSKTQFCFSNLIQPLIVHCKVSRTLNSKAIAAAFVSLTREAEQTFFENINWLRPGHYLLWKGKENKLVQHRYWSAAEIASEPLYLATPREYFQQFYILFHKVIREQLYSIQGRVGTHLSGGLDSSAVTSLSAYLRPESIYAFSHIPTPSKITQPKPDYNYDDRFYIELVTKQYPNINLVYIEDKDKKLFDYYEQLHPWLSSPLLFGGNLSWMMKIVEKAQELAINSILTGQGGNATISFRGYRTLSTIQRHAQNVKSQLKKIINKNSDFKLQSSVLNPNLLAETKCLSHYKKCRNQSMRNQNTRQTLFDYGITVPIASYQAAIRHLYGVELLDPTLDRRIVEYCLRVPNGVFQAVKGGRALVRCGLTGIMPKPICERTTRGMQAGDWYNKIDQQKNEINELLTAWSTTKVADYLNIKFLKKIMHQWDYERIAKSQNKRYIRYEWLYRVQMLSALETGLFIQKHI